MPIRSPALAFREAIAEDKKKLFGHDENHPGFITFRERVLKQYKVNRVEELPVSFRGLSLREDDEAGYRMFDRHFGRLQSQVERQDAWRAAAGILFPMLAHPAGFDGDGRYRQPPPSPFRARG